MSATVAIDVVGRPSPRAARGVAWYRTEEATEALTQGGVVASAHLGEEIEVGAELTWRATGATERVIMRLVATGDEQDVATVSAGSGVNALVVAVKGAAPAGLPPPD
jgi:hypothetical protein